VRTTPAFSKKIGGYPIEQIIPPPYNIGMTFKKSKYMRSAINYWIYDGRKPKGVSIARWNGMLKFMENNFPELKN